MPRSKAPPPGCCVPPPSTGSARYSPPSKRIWKRRPSDVPWNPAMPANSAEPALTRHPPEHGRGGAPEILPAGCCCCCCCCCLHTLGGIGGAVLGSALPMQSRPVYESDPDSPFPYRRDVFEEDQPLIPPVLLYWLIVALAVML